MLGLRLNAAKKFAKRIWEDTKNLLASDGKILLTSGGDIMNVI